MTTFLITGGAGFIGSNFLRLLAVEQHVRLIVVDALTYAGNLANIKELIDGEKVIFIHADIRDAEAVKPVSGSASGCWITAYSASGSDPTSSPGVCASRPANPSRMRGGKWIG